MESPDTTRRSRRRRKRRTSVRVFLGTADRLRLDRAAQGRGLGPSTLARTMLVDALDATEPTTSPDWRLLLKQPTGSKTRRRYAVHLPLKVLLRVIGRAKAAQLLASYGNSRLPSALTLGRQLRREALLRHWTAQRWHSRTFLRQLGQLYDLQPESVRRILGPRYLSRRTATYWRKAGELTEREEAAGVRRTSPRVSITVLS